MNETGISIAGFSPTGQALSPRVVRFPEEVIQKVWDRATGVIGYDPKVWRKDQCGAWICRTEYGKRNSPYGWEIDHIRPVTENGNNQISNLRPLHWENYVGRQEHGRLICCVTAPNGNNIRIIPGDPGGYV